MLRTVLLLLVMHLRMHTRVLLLRRLLLLLLLLLLLDWVLHLLAGLLVMTARHTIATLPLIC